MYKLLVLQESLMYLLSTRSAEGHHDKQIMPYHLNKTSLAKSVSCKP